MAAASVHAYPKTGGVAAIPAGSNPYVNVGWYVDTEYTSKVNTSYNKIVATGNMTLANLAKMAGETPTSIWLSSNAIVDTRLPAVLNDARQMNTLRTDPGGPLTVSFFVYNLPGRDCASNTKPGEYPATAAGLTSYKAWIDKIVTKVKAYPDVRVVAILEPDAIANMVMSPNDPNSRCGQARTYYQQGLQYAMGQLSSLSNIAVYTDLGHAKWMGYAQNMDQAVTLLQGFTNVTKIRGWHTNKSQYIPVKWPANFQTNGQLDALGYVNAFASRFSAKGLPSKFLIDTSRNGVAINANTFCNIIGSGMGMRPTDNTGYSTTIDAFIWSQAGESDGTGITTSPRYDWQCGSAQSLPNAPVQGEWFHDFFVQLVRNARPPLDAGRPKY